MDQEEKLLLIECVKNLAALWNQANKNYHATNKDMEESIANSNESSTSSYLRDLSSCTVYHVIIMFM